MSKRLEQPVRANRCFIAIFGGMTAAVLLTCLLAPISAQIAVVGTISAFMVALMLIQESRRAACWSAADLIQQSFIVAKNDEAHRQHQVLVKALGCIAQHNDPLFRSLALKRMGGLTGEAEHLASGTILFEDTETWRLAYEELLRSPGLYLYRSVALVNSPAYWQDEPGRRSMRLNYELQDGGSLSIERTIVIADELWPWQEYLPAGSLRLWIDEQHNHGIALRLVRRSAIAHEHDLLSDCGIYGSRAVGVQQLNQQSKTLRFVLTFGFEHVRQAEARWDRLAVYAASYRDLLERPELEL